MTASGAGGRTPLVATYRLQLGPAFTLDDAARAVPYLAGLGVSHLYLSPVWECVPGSAHGYDVIDHAAVRREIGGLAGLLRLREAASAAGLGLIADIVPNHVSVAGARHPWWRDVLRFGEASEFAPYFDIDWQGQHELPSGVLVLPVLGRPSGEALEAGELALAFDGEELVVRYFDAAFPLSPANYGAVLGTPPPGLAASLGDPAAFAAFADLLEDLATLPPDACRAALARLGRLLAAEPRLREWMEARLASFTGTPGEPASWDALDEVLARQHYRLAYWRVSGEQVNYRRFFDINELAAVRQEHPAAFEATHALVATLVRGGTIEGLRVDHIDGLYDPALYLDHLAELTDQAPVWVEKILAPGEEVPSDWKVAGTTGYDFLAIAGGLFIDPAGEVELDHVWREFSGSAALFEDVAAAAKIEVAESSFSGEVGVLAAQLHRLAQRDRRYRDVTLRAFRDAIEAVLAGFPVYRTYFEHHAPRSVDRELVGEAAARARAIRPRISRHALEFLVRVLLVDSDRLDDAARARWVHFRRRFQQVSGPIMAKGVEDTAFFRYGRLLALNEVGDHPARFGTPPSQFQAWAVARAQRWPLALSASSTHDTKRSEDARMRLAVLSELPREWRREVRAWARLNARHRAGGWPDSATEYYLYQSLVATFPGGVTPEYGERIAAHMLKAAREAKTQTSWTEPNPGYEAAIDGFVRAVLDRRRSKAFLRRLAAWVARIEPAARVNSLALLALKCLGPGVPDVYQGAEYPLYTVTDPDNRRPLDFAAASARFDDLPASFPPDFFAAKPWLLRKLLILRRRYASVFVADCRPIAVGGPAGDHVVAFERTDRSHSVIVVVPRLAARYLDAGGRVALPPLSIELDPARAWRDALSDEPVVPRYYDVSGTLARIPVAVFAGEPL